MKLIKLGITVILTAGTLFAGIYNVDKDHSNIAFKVKHMMISNVKGKFDKFNGTFEYDEGAKTLKSLHGVVDINSINTENIKRDNHLKSADFFDVTKYPVMTLAFTKTSGDTAYGDLTIHGITKKVKMNIETSGMVVKDPWGNTRTGLSVSFKISRNDFGLKWNKILEAGEVMVGDAVKIDIEIEGILKK